MRRRQVFAWLTYAGLTLPIGLFGHVLFEASGSVVGRTGDVGVDHTLLFAAAAIAFGFAVGALRRGAAAERRRRVALLRAVLPSRAPLFLAGVLGQSVVAAATLALEGVQVDPASLAVAVLLAALGILLGSCAFESVGDELFAIVAGFAVALAREESAVRLTLRDAAVAHRGRTPIRIHAGRAPPSLVAF